VNPSQAIPPVLARFGLSDAAVTPVGGGHINQAWKVVPRSAFRDTAVRGREPVPSPGAYLLQRINPEVFPDGRLVLQNVAAVCDHLLASAGRVGLDHLERRVMQVVRAPGGEAGILGDDGAWWRMLRHIDGAVAFQRAESPGMAYEAGRAFGLFQRLLTDYDGPVLGETIPRFHDTRLRLERLREAVSRDVMGRATEVASEVRFAMARAGHAEVLPPLIASGEVPTRVAHNDAKIGNVLFDRESREALAVIDLDTVMPGTLLNDVGDLIRSMASPTDEDERELSRIAVSPELIESLVRGFLEQCGATLTGAERGLLIFSGILLTYEQGVRFLTDHLEGDRYYRITRPNQNLDRARAQFALVEALEAKRAILERLTANG